MYMKKAKESVHAPGRNSQRLHGGFARVFATACLMMRYRLFPFTEPEISEAILKCEQDHVDFVAGFVPPASASSSAGAEVASPLDRLREYVRSNRDQFLDTSLEYESDIALYHDDCPGYVHQNSSRTEYLFSQKAFDRAIGGASRSDRVKRLLRGRRVLEVTGAGTPEERLVVKRRIGFWNGKAVYRYVTAIHASFFEE